jgi:hypothetical protein
LPNWKPEIVKTGSLINRVRKIEGKRRGRRYLVILFDLPAGMWVEGGPRARELMMEIARREIPEIEFSLATSVTLMPNVLSTMDPPWETTTLAAPKVARWFATELSHEERLGAYEAAKRPSDSAVITTRLVIESSPHHSSSVLPTGLRQPHACRPDRRPTIDR